MQARQLSDQWDLLGALTYLRRAVALDSAFAVAWYDLSGCIVNLGYRDSAYAILQRALTHSDRLDEMDRLGLEWDLALHRGELAGAAAAAERMVKLDPADADAWFAVGWVNARAGRFAEAAQCYERQIELFPFGPHQVVLGNLALQWIAAGRLDRARAVAAMMKGDAGRLHSQLLRFVQ